MPEVIHSAEPTLLREFVFAGELGSLAPTRDAIMELVEAHCADEQKQIDILLALQEGLANAIVHGCGQDGSKSVRCTVEITPTSITFSIQDPGSGFATAPTTDPAEEGTNLTEHGRGIYLIRSLMDEVHYRQHGSQVVMKKFRAGC